MGPAQRRFAAPEAEDASSSSASLRQSRALNNLFALPAAPSCRAGWRETDWRCLALLPPLCNLHPIRRRCTILGEKHPMFPKHFPVALVFLASSALAFAQAAPPGATITVPGAGASADKTPAATSAPTIALSNKPITDEHRVP